ncbi:MAG: carbohydrate ABC transporter permease [Clostridiales bacterium]|nr:carbohydrate ABC transporter permease [Clostridiales bacterium]
MKRKFNLTNILLDILFVIIAVVCVYPVLLVIGISLTDETALAEYGFNVIPKVWSVDAYRYIVSTGATIVRAYGVTIIVTVIGAVTSTLVVALYAYPLSRKDFAYRKLFMFLAFFTMLFSGGVVSWYMICTNMLHLKNSVWAMILPYVMNAWHVIVMRSFFSMSIPAAIIESAKIDGAGEWRIFFNLVMPLAVPGLATIGLFATLTYWNDWTLPLYFVTEPKMYNLQFLLQSMISNIQMLSENSALMGSASLLANVPKEGARMALCIIATGPILIVYPFFQKYFIQGLTVGAVKE